MWHFWHDRCRGVGAASRCLTGEGGRAFESKLWTRYSLCASGRRLSCWRELLLSHHRKLACRSFDTGPDRGKFSVPHACCTCRRPDCERSSLARRRFPASCDRIESASLERREACRKTRGLQLLGRKPLPLLSVL